MIRSVQKLAQELGRPPYRYEFTATGHAFESRIKLLFRNYSKFLEIAGIERHLSSKTILKEEVLLHRYKSLTAKKEQIQGFFRSTLDLTELFDRAGHPKTLKLIAQPDTHVKFVDPMAYTCFLKFLGWYNPDVLMIMGDFADCEGISHWDSQSLEPKRIVPEMKRAREFLKLELKATPKATTRIFLEGNHEHWIDLALNKMPELFEGLGDLGIEISLKTLLALESFGFQLFPLNELVQIGKAHFTHGIYTGGAHAKKHLDVFKANIYYGHLHDTQEHNQTSMEGHMESSSLGCLCRLDAKFLKGKPNNWVHSFGVFEFFPDGTYTFIKPKIINGRLSFNGEVFEGDPRMIEGI